ncbi:J domain-containing protein [Roseomonas sp. OT10]|uniref:J domain-containing protein n=1 Tax=Roseomonas cutis TaxID=2897332 RepID=UPI001E6233EE|nr:J domain-containing protein [Roseomonas sp. OT10]UFN48200.1 J domain-containing protein [Roseomonas sp. OT10]
MARRGATSPTPPPRGSSSFRPCEAPGCEAAGEFRAPRDRSRLRDYYHFCLEHVRAYNQAWDFYKGMTPDEIEQHLKEDNGWQRPTWPLGRLGTQGKFDPAFLKDPLGLFADAKPAPRKSATKAPAELRAALDVLGLGWPLDEEALRERWKELAKRYHPDANGGDKSAEERLKDVNRAYSLLRKRLATMAQPVASAAA